MKLHWLIVLVHIFSVGLFGQGLPKQSALPESPAPPGVTISEAAIPLPLELRDKFRDLQHENDAIEIENQTMLLKIEQNKARQVVIVDQEMAIASQFGREKNLDLAQYELDPAPITLRKKKTK